MAGIGTIFVELDLDASRYRKGQQQLYKDATTVSLNIEENFRKLGVKSSAEMDLMRAKIQNSFDMIKNSGKATANDIVRAEEAKNAKLHALNEQQFGHQTTIIENLKNNWIAAAAVIGTAMIAANKAWGTLKTAADYDEQAGILNNLALKYKTTADSIISEMKRASDGQVASADLMKVALGGVAKGLKPEQLIKLADAARILGDSVGQNATVALTELSEALEAGRTRTLKGYAGAVIDIKGAFGDLESQLTGVEKAQAMYSLVMIHATKLQKEQKKAVDDTADTIEKIEAKYKDLQLSVSRTWKAIVVSAVEGAAGMGTLFHIMFGKQATKGPNTYDVPPVGAGTKEDPAAEYKKQIEELKKLLQARKDAEDASRNSASNAARAAAERERALDAYYKHEKEILVAIGKAEEDMVKEVESGVAKSLEGLRQAADLAEKLRTGNLSISASTPDKFGNVNTQGAMQAQLEGEIVAANKLVELYAKDSEQYLLAQERKKLLTEKFNAEKKRLDIQSWENSAEIMSGQFGQIAGMMDQGNAEQFAAWKALAIGEATIAGALTFMKMMGSTTYPMNMVLAGMSAAITTGQIAKIAGTQYQGRAEGGPVNSGQTYWVGEKGVPELFTPGSSGMITPADKMGGLSLTITNHVDARGAGPDTDQKIRVAMKQTQDVTMAAIYQSMQRGGRFAVASGRMK